MSKLCPSIIDVIQYLWSFGEIKTFFIDQYQLLEQMLIFFRGIKPLSKPVYSSPILQRFSEVAAGNGNIPKAYEDWQYCKMITQQLKNNNINNALSLLFQSYFNNQILDIQIYNQIQQKMMAAALPLSYSEIVYKVYREHFPPHVLISNWMSKLTYSKSEQFVQKLKKDFQLLGQPFPHRSPRAAKRQAKKQAKTQTKTQVKTQKSEPTINDQAPSTPKRSRSNKVVTETFSSIELPNADLPKMESEMTPEELYRTKVSNEVKNALSQLNVDTNSFSRIVVHDVSVEFGNDEQYQDEETPSDQQEQFGEEDMQNMGFFGLEISKVNIGRIQFFNDNRKEQ